MEASEILERLPDGPRELITGMIIRGAVLFGSTVRKLMTGELPHRDFDIYTGNRDAMAWFANKAGLRGELKPAIKLGGFNYDLVDYSPLWRPSIDVNMLAVQKGFSLTIRPSGLGRCNVRLEDITEGISERKFQLFDPSTRILRKADAMITAGWSIR